MKTLRLVVVLAVAAVGALALSSSGSAVPRQRAIAAALAFLKPQAFRTPVIVYGLPAPLAPGVTVTEFGGAHARRLTRKAWLFWEDLFPEAGFLHPSRLVLVDDATARVTFSADLWWWPVVGGKSPAFLRRPADPRYQVFSTAGAARRVRAARALRMPQAVRSPGSAGWTGERDCYVSAVDLSGTEDPAHTHLYFEGNHDAMKSWADTLKLPSGGDATDAGDLRARIKRLTDDGCNDVVVYLNGHGLPKPGATFTLQKNDNQKQTIKAPPSGDAVSPVAAVALGSTQNLITSTDISNIVKSYVFEGPDHKFYASVRFKLVIDSCFSGRFIDDLQPLKRADADHPDPPIRAVATSSASGNLTYNGYTATARQPSAWTVALQNAFAATAKNPTVTAEENGDLAAFIADSARLADDTAFRLGDRPDGHPNWVKLNNPQTELDTGAHPLGEPREPPPQEPDVKPIYAFFNQDTFTTTYTVFATPDPIAYKWVLAPDPNDKLGCKNGGQLTSSNATFSYYHGSDQCDHAVYNDNNYGHQAGIAVTLTFPGGQVCSESIFGTTTGYAVAPRPGDNSLTGPCAALGTG